MALVDGLGGGTGIADILEEINVNTVITSTNRLYFRDAGLSIHSDADGRIVITSDGSSDDAIKFDGPATILAGENAGGEGLTIKDSDTFPVVVLDSDGNVKHKGVVQRTTTG